MELTTRDHLETARKAALDLHKVLLDAVRVDYERAHGRIEAPAELLRLVTNDPTFAWLRPLSQLIVAIDDCAEDPDADPREAAALRGELSRLLDSPHFQPQYLDCLQRAPDVVLAHARLRQQLA